MSIYVAESKPDISKDLSLYIIGDDFNAFDLDATAYLSS